MFKDSGMRSIPSSALQRQQQQRTLEVLSALSYRTGDLQSYLQAIAQGVSELIGVDWSVVTLCQDGAEKVLASTLELGEAAHELYSLHGTLTGTVLKRCAPLVIEDAANQPEFGKPPNGYRAYLGVPLRTPLGKVVGTICSFHRIGRCFTPEEVCLVEIFAERAATAIDNYQLYQQQRQVNERLEAEIQERRAVEQALRQSEERFRALIEQAGDAIFVHDLNGRIVDANQQACDSLGYTRDELLRLSVADIECRLTREAIAQLRQQKLAIGPCTLEGLHRRKDGSTFPVEVRLSLIELGGQQFELALIRDISERKRAKAALQQLAEVGELAAMIVHEVRNPLTTVMMGLKSFKRLNLSTSAHERLALALEEAERLKSLLNEILLYARPQTLQAAAIEVNQFITDLLEILRSMPAASGRQIQFMPAVSPLTIRADQDKLKQVFINLITNACEAVAEGEVITWQVKPDHSERVTITIHNWGEPISPEVLPRLTKPFVSTKPSGTGLGLAIVKRIVEAHAGELKIESAIETGTLVSVVLPIATLPTSS
jgi:PAS domain S-box-containing protein